MTTFLWLLLLSVIMAITSLAVGLFPLKARVALHHMNLASALSMGILVGTALAAVIPEGVQMLLDSGYSNNPDSGMALSGVIGLSLIVGFAVMFLVDHYEQLITTGEVSNTLPEQDSIWKSFLRSPLTLGLLLHSFVDGIALGTAFVNNDDSFQILFLLMITIHNELDIDIFIRVVAQIKQQLRGRSPFPIQCWHLLVQCDSRNDGGHEQKG
ncbi:CIC11C00000005788 [Sungouiella intermedia]|uniref:CIC11C00000005788 n=1 Tax=Sungouiella intermedia TaxID=45354 RepID=A0A1L0C0T9_9ASCO|nr:CIC11C00000005788 [[Candida] intermedia]